MAPIIVRAAVKRLAPKIAALAAVLPAAAYAAETACRSEQGGYCLNLAGVAATDLLAQTNTGDFLANLYVFGLGVVALSSLIMLTLGAVTYMTAGDSQERSGKGKTYMKNALWGLILALLSWLILYTINPDFTRKLNITLEQIPVAPTSQ